MFSRPWLYRLFRNVYVKNEFCCNIDRPPIDSIMKDLEDRLVRPKNFEIGAVQCSFMFEVEEDYGSCEIQLEKSISVSQDSNFYLLYLRKARSQILKLLYFFNFGQ